AADGGRVQCPAGGREPADGLGTPTRALARRGVSRRRLEHAALDARELEAHGGAVVGLERGVMVVMAMTVAFGVVRVVMGLVRRGNMGEQRERERGDEREQERS